VCGSFSEAFPFRAGLPPPNLNYELRGSGIEGLSECETSTLPFAVVSAEAAAGIFARGV